jgi:secreted trypsin-like serine protease
MKRVSIAAYCGIALGLMLSFPIAGYPQSPLDYCKSLDDPSLGAAAAPPRDLQAFQEATPEALRAFRELSRTLPLGGGGRIVGGHPVAIEKNLWQIAMVRASVAEPERSQFCGGSIIGDTWILTAAHCVRNSVVREDPRRVDVIAGTRKYALGGERLKVAAIHMHPMYNPATMDHDFALMRLQSPVTKGKVIELVQANTPINEGTPTCVTGWGATFEGGPGAIDILGAEVPIVSTEVCNRPESYGGDVTASMMCAGKRDGGLDSCQGDSGGPLSTLVGGRPTLIGVVSWGEGCARRLKYGIYSRVSTVLPWIASTTAGR